MAGEMERDARLILRAEDRASRTFEQVAKSIKNVREEIVQQQNAAEKGVGDIASYTNSLKALQNAGDDLVKGQSLIKQFESAGEAVGKAEVRLQSATKALDDYQKKVGAQPTDNQSAQIEKKALAVTKAQANLEKQSTNLASVEKRMETAGIATVNLESQFEQMGLAAVQAAQGIAAAKAAIDDYPASVKRATLAAEELAAAQALGGKSQDHLAPADFAYVASLDTAREKLAALSELQALEVRQTKVAQAADAQRRAAQLAGINEVLRGNDALDAQFKELAADEARLKDVAVFRQVGIDAAESAVKVERYGATVSALGNDFQSLAATVRAAMGGSAASLQDINVAIAQIDTSFTAASTGTKAAVNELQASAGQLAIAQATLVRTAEKVDAFTRQEHAVRSAEAAFSEAQAEVLRLAAAIAKADAPTEELAADMARAEKALASAGNAMQRERNEAVKLGSALKAAGVDTHNLEAEQKRFQAAADNAGKAAQGLQGKLRGKGGFLGLNPYELQNLGYQINDVFTQIASGTPITQVAAQQGGQVVQIFKGLGGAIIGLLPLIAAVGLLASPFIDAALQAGKAKDAVKAFSIVLAGTGELQAGAVAQYAQASVQLQNMGNTAKESTAALKEFHTAGLDPAALGAFSQAIGDAAKGGADLTDTSKLLAEALAGGSKEVEALNDKFNILTPAEEAQVEKMLESGQESEARRILFEKFEVTADRMADKANGQYSDSWNNLTRAFHNFSSAISDSRPFAALSGFLAKMDKDLAHSLDGLTYFFNYASKRGFFGAILDGAAGPGALGYKPTKEQLDAAAFANGGGRQPKSNKTPMVRNGPTLNGARAIREETEALDDQKRSLKQLTRAQTDSDARKKALRTAPVGASDAERQQLASLASQRALLKFDDDASKAAERKAKKGQSAANKAARAAETLANQRKTLEEGLVRDLDGLDAKVEKQQDQSLASRLEAVDKSYTAIFQKIEQFKAKGGTKIEGQSIAAYTADVNANLALLKQMETMKFYEEQINNAIKERKALLDAVADSVKRGDTTPTEGIAQSSEIISRFAPKITGVADDAKRFAESIRGAAPSAKLEAFIAKMGTNLQKNSGGQDANLLKGIQTDAVDKGGKDLNAVLAQRNDLVSAENALVEAGVKTRRDAQTTIEKGYASTQPALEAQIASMRELLAMFKDDPSMQIYYDTWMAKLDGIAAKSGYVSSTFTQLKNGIDQILTSGIVNGIDTIAQSFANLALGQQGVLATLGQIGAAFLNFISSTIIGIAKLILQMIILSAVEKVTGIPIGAFLKVMGSGLHTGGVVGQERTFSRSVPATSFLGAPKYHGGGLAGFAPDEVPAILKKNEEVLTQADPRHRFNLGKGGNDAAPPPQTQKNVLVLDPAELANAMAGPAGEKVMISHIRRNKTTIKQMIG